MRSPRIVSLGALAVSAGLLQGCSTAQPAWEAQSYTYRYLNLRAVPTDPATLHRECAFLYYEMAEVEDFLQKYSNIGHSDGWTLEWTAEAWRRSADLASRYKQIRCQIRPAAPAKQSDTESS
jgi:hypothetical protein